METPMPIFCWENGEFLWQGALRRQSGGKMSHPNIQQDMEKVGEHSREMIYKGWTLPMSMNWRENKGILWILMIWIHFCHHHVTRQETRTPMDVWRTASASQRLRMETIQAIHSFGGSCAWSITTTLMLVKKALKGYPLRFHGITIN